VLPQAGAARPPIDEPTPEMRAVVEAQIRAANHSLAVHQRVVAWRFWPELDFPRTHTFKVKRDTVRAWVVLDQPLPVREDDRANQERPGGP
jgi:hypothetical protein